MEVGLGKDSILDENKKGGYRGGGARSHKKNREQLARGPLAIEKELFGTRIHARNRVAESKKGLKVGRGGKGRSREDDQYRP